MKVKEKEEFNKVIKWVYKEFVVGVVVFVVFYYMVRNILLDMEIFKILYDCIVFMFRWMFIFIFFFILVIFDVLNVWGIMNVINLIVGKLEYFVEVLNRILWNGME